MKTININKYKSNKKGLPKDKHLITKFDKSIDDKRFLKGPIPLRWLIKAAQLPGKSMTIAIAIWFLCGVKRSLTIKLSGKLLREFNISRSTSYRGLKRLENAGLIVVERHRGRNAIVTIIKETTWEIKRI